MRKIFLYIRIFNKVNFIFYIFIYSNKNVNFINILNLIKGFGLTFVENSEFSNSKNVSIKDHYSYNFSCIIMANSTLKDSKNFYCSGTEGESIIF
jgi:hypothetical protein